MAGFSDDEYKKFNVYPRDAYPEDNHKPEEWKAPHRVVISNIAAANITHSESTCRNGGYLEDLEDYISGSYKPSTPYKYNEDKYIIQIQEYLDKTYKQHYAIPDEDLQAIDAWFALGNADTSCRDTIIKYAWRFGKKEGHKKDIMKVIHYCLFLLHDCDRKKRD